VTQIPPVETNDKAAVAPKPKLKKPVGRRTRTIQSLFVMIAIGAGLSLFNSITLRNDTATATGPESAAQQSFFANAADRPDIAVFFKNLSHDQRIAMAKNIGRYDNAKLSKLAAVLLADFDADARKELTASLVSMAKTRTKEIADQMIQKGSFQQTGVAAALDAAGKSSWPFVAEMLKNGDARPFAAAYLTDKGTEAGPLLLEKLSDKDKDTRLAAADALGKLAYRPAVTQLRNLYDGVGSDATKFDELIGYLSALSGTGDASLEPLFSDLLNDSSKPIPTRATAAFGLGRIGTASAARTVWKYADSDDRSLADNAVAALQRAGLVALQTAPPSGDARVRVAAGIPGAASDQLLVASIATDSDVNLLLASGRPNLVATLESKLAKLSGEEDGDKADAIIRALASTPAGESKLRTGTYAPAIQALINRRLGAVN
jgi:HEAT repeat protein